MVIAHDARREILQFDETVGLTPESVGDHRWGGANRRNHRYPNTPALHGPDGSSEGPVAREQNGVIDVLGHFEHIDRQLDIHVALDAAPPHRVGKFLCWL